MGNFPSLPTPPSSDAASHKLIEQAPVPPSVVPLPEPKAAAVRTGKALLDLSTGRLKTDITFGKPDRKFTVTHERVGKGAYLLSALVEGPKWSAAVAHPSKDIKLTYRPKLARGTWLLKQSIPGGNWALFPAPCIQAIFKPLQLKQVTDKLTLSYSYLTRLGAVREELEFLDGRLSVMGVVDTVTKLRGADVSVLLNRPSSTFAKKLGLYYSQAAGPRMSCRTDPSSSSTLTGTLDLKAQSARVVLDVTQSPGTSVEVAARVSAKQLGSPAITIGVKTSF